ncbi:CinA family protein [Aestuariicella hydrocarbonica]|uniref:CinA family protein n=1 Tax=Pseudomaricurvus hydrocarbonicus TaxID=1470433 RepID=A0A9E5MQ63_9GAMM|nr:CinA family protein [Aestuariicella hydrocarbonica]NHO68303.1 CinA family protein [Aestuariicella hydrocarbonica]
MSAETLPLCEEIGRRLTRHNWCIGTAESCTGGMLSAAITDVAGSSGWFEEGLVTYANESKERLLSVPKSVLESEGAVSQAVVEAMVAGVLARGADVAVATSGVAGPDGGSDEKPVGTVWFAWALPHKVASECRVFEGDRMSVRTQATIFALSELLALLELEQQ